MRIIKKSTLSSFWKENPLAQNALIYWYALTKAAQWTNLQDTKTTFPHADLITVKSGRKVIIFNIGGNKYRLVTAIHYNRQVVYILLVLTHSEYTKERWKEIL